MDIVITDEGKRQAASGNLRVKYATFTDRHAFYQDISGSVNIGVADDASDRFYFEALSKPQDRVVVETEEVYGLDGSPQGRKVPFKGKDFVIEGGKISTGSLSSLAAMAKPEEYIKGALSGSYILTGSEILDKSFEISQTIISHFNDQMIISTHDPFSPSSGFDISVTPSGDFLRKNSGCILEEGKLKFIVSHYSPFLLTDKNNAKYNARLEEIESFFSDKKLSHLDNYQYLPPVNELVPGESTQKVLGKYFKTNQMVESDIQQLNETLANKPYFDVDFDVTSRDNNIISQIFEFNSSTGLQKLSIIDYGEWEDEDPLSFGKRVFFVGKIYVDQYGSMTFVNIFTIVFD